MYKTFIKKPLLIAKLTMVLLTAAFLQVSAKSSALAINNATEVPQKTVTGKVTDDKGEGLPGVTVKVKGGTAAVVTDPQGNFRITSADNATLVFTFIGFQTQEMSVAGKSVINVSLATEASNLDEVVVVAYGTQKRTSVTGAVSTINPAEIKRNSVTDITNAIVGRTPGIRVTQTSSLPGRFDTQIDVRGYGGAFNVGSTPLFVIDGVPRGKSDFDHMDANEIESFSVLKDASAAIYGVQGANGVILVTTRKGTAGKVQVNYTGQYGSQFILTYPKLMNSYQHSSTYDEMQFNQAYVDRADPITPRFNYGQIQDWYNGKGVSVDWVRAIEGNRSNQTQHNITFSGGSDKVKFFTSGGYLDEGGLLKSKIERSQKYNARQAVTAEIGKGLTLETNVDFVNERWSGPNNGTARTYDLVRNTWGIEPQQEIYLLGDPKLLRQYDPPDPGVHNPYGLIQRDVAGFEDNDQKQFHTVTTVSWVVPYIKGLTAKGLIGWDTTNQMDINFVKNFKQYKWDYTSTPGTPILQAFDHPGQSTLNQSYNTSIRDDVQFSLNYQKHFGKSNLTVLGLYEWIYNGNSSMNGGTTFAVDVNPALGSGIPSLATSGGGPGTPNSSRSYIGRINYDYAGKYLLEVGGRYGGSSYFPANSRWGLFPYASAGWRISQEPFIQNNLKFVDNLKLRASYGTTGDDGGARDGFPAFITGFTYPRVSSFYAANNGNRDRGNQSGTVFGTAAGITKGYIPKFVANPDITWYSSTTTDIGLEGSLFKGKLTFEADVFRRDRDGILGQRIVAIPANFGAVLPDVNLNSDRTQGFELTLGTRQQSGEVNWGISANYAFTRSNYRHREETPANSPYDNWTGKSTGRYTDFIRGYVTDGQFQSQQEITAYPVMIDGAGNRTVLPGDLRFVDVNGNGSKDGNDQVILAAGGSKPRAYFGVTIDAQWRGFDITMLIQGATSYNLRYTDAISKPFVRDPQDPITSFIDRWHHEDLFNQNSPWVPGRWPSTGSRNNSLDGASSFTVFNGSYARIKQLQIGYALPKKMLSKLNISKLRVFASAFNLYTWAGKGLDFVDPEYNPNNQSTSSSSFNPPITMNVTAGAQLTF